ncbi:[protein-PII] uridylyltransferase [Nocardioides coralli]|nr:[protein-PII] uridylyltransferase [Nocardioides coralli]
MTDVETRAERTAAADTLCVAAFEKVEAPVTGVALVAVGGYGRGELAPCSDLDVVLVHDDDVRLGGWAGELWYPIWDSGTRLDHAVRALPQMTAAAGTDLKVALGLLDTRHLAGDPNLTLRLRTTMLTQWRRDARRRLPELREMVRARHEQVGELAHLSVPDLKEAAGGLRDATILRALVASWLVDVPHPQLRAGHRSLLDVRDRLHALAGRATDRIAPEHWPGLAHSLGLEEAATQQHVREVGRRLTHLSRLTWRRVEAVQGRRTPVGVRRPELTSIAPGVALSAGEVVLDRGADPAADPLLLLRAAAEAAERDVVLAPPTAARLVRECAPIPEPWPRAARQLLVRLLAAGPGLLAVWETLDETGALPRLLPEWERIRLLPHASEIHRFTVDRHVVETCIEASALIRDVARPDVLMVAALLHDIGKGGPHEHCAAGEPIARDVAARIGLGREEVETVATLVRWHLLLAETATTRDPDDPATLDHLVRRIPDVTTARLLLALTEADARATAPKAWSSWRAGLVTDLARRLIARLDEDEGTGPPALGTALPATAPASPEFVVESGGDDCRVTVVAADRVGLLADVAAVLTLQRLPVRTVRAWTEGDVAASVWSLDGDVPDVAVLRQRYDALTAARLGVPARARPVAPRDLEPRVALRPDASREATVLEVRAADRTGVLQLTLETLADLDIWVRSAHADTLGPQAVDVFYLQESGAGALSDTRAAAAAHAVRDALSPPAPAHRG